MNSAKHGLRVVFAPGVHVTRAAKDAIAARLGGLRDRRHLWADFIVVTGCRLDLIAAVGLLRGTPHVLAVEDGSRRAVLSTGTAAAPGSATACG